MKEPVAKKQYYSIGEVCELMDLKPHVLRYWETQFEVLHPTKNRAGNRVYRPKDVQLILLVKHLLYDEKYTIEGGRRKLLEMRRSGELDGAKRANLEPRMVDEMRSELLALRETLTAPPPPAEVS